MIQLDEKVSYYLGDLTDEQLEIFNETYEKLKTEFQVKGFDIGWYKRYYKEHAFRYSYEEGEYVWGFTEAYHKGTTNALELFKDENKNGWYKLSGKSLFHIDFDTKQYYGFNFYGNWFDIHPITSDFYSIEKVETKEVRERLLKEAKKRGFNREEDILISSDLTVLQYKEGRVIFRNGVWSEVENKDNVSIQDFISKDTSENIFYYLKSSHGENFYKILEITQVKNEFHDWKNYVRYQQLGTNLIFNKPEEMFYKEFTKITI